MDVNVEAYLGKFDPGHVILMVFGGIILATAIFAAWVVYLARRDLLARRRNDLLKKLVQDIAEAQELPLGRREQAIAIARAELTEVMTTLGLLIGGSLNLEEGVKLFSPDSLGLVIEEQWLFEFQASDIRVFSRPIAQMVFEAYGRHPYCLDILHLMNPDRPARQYLENHLGELLRVDDRQRQQEKAVSSEQKARQEKAKLIRRGFKACGQKLPESLEHYAKPKKYRRWAPPRQQQPALAQTRVLRER